MARAWLVWLVVAAGCTPMASIDRLAGELGAAKEKRRVVALASPT